MDIHITASENQKDGSGWVKLGLCRTAYPLRLRHDRARSRTSTCTLSCPFVILDLPFSQLTNSVLAVRVCQICCTTVISVVSVCDVQLTEIGCKVGRRSLRNCSSSTARIPGMNLPPITRFAAVLHGEYVCCCFFYPHVFMELLIVLYVKG